VESSRSTEPGAVCIGLWHLGHPEEARAAALDEPSPWPMACIGLPVMGQIAVAPADACSSDERMKAVSS